MQEGFSQRVLFRPGQEQTHSKSELKIAHFIRVFAIEKLVDFIDRDNIWYVSHLVIESGQIYVELVIVVISKHLEHGLIQLFFLHDCPNHVAVYKLINLFDRHIHPVVS